MSAIIPIDNGASLAQLSCFLIVLAGSDEETESAASSNRKESVDVFFATVANNLQLETAKVLLFLSSHRLYSNKNTLHDGKRQ